jgi:hypothetical protein
VAGRISEARKIAPYIRGAARAAISRELAQRIVVAGQTPLQAAAEMNLTRDQLYKILRGAAYKRESAELFGVVGNEKTTLAVEAVRRLWELVPKAIDRTAGIVESSEDDAVALRACNSILDRTGFRTQTEEARQQTVLVLTQEQAEALAEALRVARARTIEVTATPGSLASDKVNETKRDES